MGCGDVRLLRTIGGIDFTGQERAALNKLTMPETVIHSGKPYSLSEAFAAADRWCTYKMYKLVVEGRPWGGKALDQV